MNRQPEKPLPETLQAWGERFVSVVAEQPSKRRLPVGRGVVAAIAAAVVTGGVAAAATDVFDFDPEQTDLVVVQPGRTVAYMDLSTNEPIRCPDGSLLTLTFTSETTPDDGPECADGSVPETFTEQSRAYADWLREQPAGAALRDGPNFTFLLSDDGPLSKTEMSQGVDTTP